MVRQNYFHEDDDVASSIWITYKMLGGEIFYSIQKLTIFESKSDKSIDFIYWNMVTAKELRADALLVATGRRANIEDLHVENAGVQVSGVDL